MTGPLTQKVVDFDATMRGLVPDVQGPDDWAPLAEFVAVDDFERVGTFLEVHDWDGYLAMLTGWATHVERFETTVRRITEIGSLVFYEIEERHFRGDTPHVVNSMTVFAFDDDGRIHHLDVYLQQAR